MTKQEDLSPLFLDAVISVCKYPQLFSKDGSVEEVASYLLGINYAISRLHPGSRDPTGWMHFQWWLARRYAHLCGDMHNLIHWSYLKAAFPDTNKLYEQLPLLFAESLGTRPTAPPTPGCCAVYYGIRLQMSGEAELVDMDDDEERTLRRLGKAGLKSWWAPAPATSGPHYLLIGTSLGVFHGNYLHEAVFTDAALTEIMERTRQALQQLGYAETPALIIQWDALWPRAPKD